MNNEPVDNMSLNNVPMTVVAKFGEVTVYQTSAATVASNNTDSFAKQRDNLDAQQIGQTSYGALNLGLHVQDDPKQVLQNRMHLLSAINNELSNSQALEASCCPIKRLHWVNQVHGKHIHDIDTTTLTMQPVNADAMISRQANIGLAIMTADCVPIVLYQPTTGQIAAIHAGWQGLACGVIKATAEKFDVTAPIKALVGVCISQANYEVNRDVSERLLIGCINNQLLKTDTIEDFATLFTMAVDADKLKIDLPKIAIAQLQLLNITITNELPIACSYGDSRYYSYRRQTHLQQVATGRMALIIVRHDPRKN